MGQSPRSIATEPFLRWLSRSEGVVSEELLAVWVQISLGACAQSCCELAAWLVCYGHVIPWHCLPWQLQTELDF